MTVLQQLPQPPAVFVDRDPLLTWLGERCGVAAAAGRPAYLALHGPAGVGVRSLVHQWYSQQGDRFPDGALRVPLGDAVAGDEPLVAEALADVLAELGVPRIEMPASAEARSKALLTRTYSLSVLLVLEEVTSAAQVRHFLLNSPNSAVVVISRSRIRRLDLLGFEARAVEPLAERFGLELFERVLGPEWFGAAGVPPESVARACGGYPLAIRATAAQIATSPEWEVADLIRDVAGNGLGALDPESQEFVRDSFDRAYQRLSDEQARAYRLVAGLYPGQTVFVDAAAVLLDLAVEQARALLVALSETQLLTRTGADRFEYHDVAHWHARDRAEAEEPFAHQLSAVDRLLRWYLAQTVRRDRVLSDRPRLGAGYQAPAGGPVTRAAALDWLEERRANLLAAVLLAERYQLPDLVWQLCEALWGVFHLHGHYEEWITTHRAAVEAATQLGDARVRMRMTSQLGSALLAIGDLEQAAGAFAESHRCAVEAGDAVGAQSAAEWQGKTEARNGRVDSAMAYYDQSWTIAETQVPEHLRPRMFALLWLQRARALLIAADHAPAGQAAAHAVQYFRGTGESDNLAKSLLAQAKALAAMADATAVDIAREAAELFRADGSARGEADGLEIVVGIAPADADHERLRELRNRH